MKNNHTTFCMDNAIEITWLYQELVNSEKALPVKEIGSDFVKETIIDIAFKFEDKYEESDWLEEDYLNNLMDFAIPELTKRLSNETDVLVNKFNLTANEVKEWTNTKYFECGAEIIRIHDNVKALAKYDIDNMYRDLPESIKEFIDYEKYGKDCLEHTGVYQLKSGRIIEHDCY